MTAINVLFAAKKAFVLTDTIAYGAKDGIPHSFHRKAIAVSGQRTIVATRGDARLANAFAQAFPEVYDGIDEAIDDDFDVLKEIYEIHLGLSEDPARQAMCDVIFVGWSEASNSPIAKTVIRRETWETRDIDPEEGMHAPALEGQHMADFVDTLDIKDMSEFDPRRDGILLLEAQRRVKFSLAGCEFPPMNIVGGQVHLTTLTERGVAQEIIHDWHDRLGVPIQPKPYERKPTKAPSGMNRKERRVWQKKHGRIAA